MTKRKILAAATVTALPLFLGSLQAVSHPSDAPAPTADTVSPATTPAGPRWAWAAGLEGGTSRVEVAVVLDCDPGTLGHLPCEVLFAL